MIVHLNSKEKYYPTILVGEIPCGMVFSGELSFFSNSIPDVHGVFLRLETTVLDVNTYQLRGAGNSGGSHDNRVRVVRDYKPYQASVLEVRE